MTGEWREVTFEQLGKIVTGKTPSSQHPEYFGGEIPFVTPSDFSGSRLIESTERHLTDMGSKAVKGSNIPSGAIMVSCIGSDMGKSAIAVESCVTNQQINSIIAESGNDPLFVYYNLSTRKEEIRSSAGGSAQPILNKSAFGQLKIILPPLPEQRAIAHILGTLDDKIELNRRMNRTLEEMARAIFQDWFVDFGPVRAKLEGRDPYLPSDLWDLFPDRLVDSDLGEIPEGWEVKALGDAIRILDNLRVPLNSRQRTQRKGRYRYYGAAGILDYVDDFLFDGVHVLTGEDGSVIDQSGHPVTQYVWGQFWVNNHAHVLKGKMGFCDEHIYLLAQAQDIGAFVTGAVQPKLSQSNLKLIPIVVPSTFLLEAFPTVVQPIFGAIRFNSDETFVLAAQRDVLLPELVSGEVKVRDFTARGVVT